MSRLLTNLILIAVLPVCPLLCQTVACCAADEISPAAPGQKAAVEVPACCAACPAHTDPAGRSTDSAPSSTPGRDAPCPPADPCSPGDRCADPCLCNGALVLTNVADQPAASPSLTAPLPAGPERHAGSLATAGGSHPAEMLPQRDVIHARMSLRI